MRTSLHARSHSPLSLIPVLALAALAACSGDPAATGQHEQGLAATQLAFNPLPGNTGLNYPNQIRVEARDVNGDVDTTFTGTITIAIGLNPGGANLTGTLSVAAAAGVAVFYPIGVDAVADGYTLTANAGGLPQVTSPPFDVVPFAGPDHLQFTVQPTNLVSGGLITPAVEVTVRDAGENVVLSYTGDVTLAFGTNPGGDGVLLGDLTVAAVAGVATFSDLQINQGDTGYTLTASAAFMTGATSAPFDVAAGAATAIVATVSPGPTAATATLTPFPAFEIRDNFGSLVTAFNGAVTVDLGANPGGSTLSGTTTVNAIGGVATFTDLSLNKSGTGYTLTATSGLLTPGTTSGFTIVAGAATHLAFTGQPSTAVAGNAIAPAIVVQARDAGENLATGFTGNVTLAIGTNPNAGTLSGTLTVAAVGGVATFATVEIDRAGIGYTLDADSGGLTGDTSGAFDIQPGSASQLVITVEPTAATAGVPNSPAVVVQARDALGNLDPSFVGLVTASKNTGPGAGTLSGTTAVNAVGGVATFSNLRLNLVGTYTLAFNASGVTGDTSASFAISAATAASLQFTVEPTQTASGASITPAVVVTAFDAFGNYAPSFSGSVTISKNSGPGAGVLSGNLSKFATLGIATFSDLSVDLVGAYTLAATASGLTGDTSASFNIVGGAANHLVFSVQPSSAVAGDPIAPAIVVHARDLSNNLATGFTGNVTLGISTNPSGGILSGTLTVAAVGGIATFSTAEINLAGTGYTLIANASGVTGVISNAFNITSGTASQLVITVEPTSVVAGAAIAPSVVVQARDALGNLDTTFTAQVTATKNTGPGAGTLSGTTAVNAVGGIATFSNLRLNLIGSYTLAFNASGVTGDTSASFTVSAGAAASLQFSGQPSTTVAGQSIAPAVTVTALDTFGNIAVGFAGAVTISKNSGPGAGVLAGDLSNNAVLGIATFSDLSLDVVGSYTLAANAPGLTAAVSASFTITPGAAAALFFTVQPSNATAGVANSPAVQVTARDALGNTATGFGGTVTITKATGPVSGLLTGTTAVAAASGIATFSNLVLDKSGTYSLQAASGALTIATSTTFQIGHAAASHLAFSVQPPATTVAGVAMSPALQVSALDAFDNLASSFNSNIIVAFANNPSGAALSGTLTVAASGGTASFSTLSVNLVGTGYTLGATGGALTAATSSAFTITAAAASQLDVTGQPSNTVAGVAISPAVVVTARDPFGNVATGFGGPVTVVIGNDAGPGGSLTGTSPVNAVSGIATFSNLSIDRTGVGYTLVASSGALTPDTSAAFNITPAAPTNLAFTVPPATAVAGVAIAPAVVVRARDQFNNLATQFTGSITVAIGTNAGGGTLSGTLSVNAIGGISTFSNLSIEKTGVGYTLTANSGVLTGATSAAFNITPAAPTHLVFAVQPSNVIAGVSIAPAPTVHARDQFENLATQFNGTITVAIGTNPGTSTLSGTNAIAATLGASMFTNLSLNKTGTGYTLTASAGGLLGITSSAFNVSPAAASRIVYANNPSNTVAGVAITPAVTLIALDPFDNVATGFTGPVTMAISNNPGGSTLGGLTTVNGIAGNITFATLSLDKVGTGYTLAASSGSLTGAISSAFNITPAAAAKLVFTVQPTTALAGATLTPAVALVARDAFDNFATGFNGSVSMAIANNPGGSNLLGTTAVTAVAGNVTFNNLQLNRVGVGYTLSATSAGLTPATSAAFDILAGDANRLFFTVQPTSTVAGQALAPAVQVTVRDAFGNLATSFVGDVAVAISSNPGSAVLSGTTTQAAIGGIATFANLSLDKVGSGYTLAASGTGLVSTTSTVFNISSAPAVALTFSVQPPTAAAGVAITPAIAVTARDTFGNQATTFAGDITLAIANNPSAGTLGGTVVRTPVAGVATFIGVTIDRVGTGYTLAATAGGLPMVTSNAFDVVPGAPAQLVFTVQPTTTASGQAIVPPVRVEARDSQGNVATQFTSPIAVAIGTNPSGATLSGTTMVNAVAGVATFATLSLDLAGSGYTLVATGGGMTPGTSAAFEITAANASRLVFTVQPSSGTAGVALAPAIRVEARDANGNLDGTFTGTVAIALAANPGTATLMGTVSAPAVGGQVTFANLTLDKSGTGYSLVASTPGLVSATSNTFNIVAAAADSLVFITQPGDSIAGATLTPAVVVEARDAFDNRATSFTGMVTVAIEDNPGSSTLGGTAVVAAVAGRATFSTLTLDKVGTDYTLSADAAGLVGDLSAAFDISHAAANRLAFSVQPSDVLAGEIMVPAVVVEARDAFGNRVLTFAGAISLSIGTNPGPSTLGGTASAVAAAGIATFADLTLDVAADGYTLAAASSGLTGTVSATFDVMPGSASRLAFTIQPSDALAGASLTPAVVVEARDESGNLVPTFDGVVFIAISTNPGASTLSGTQMVAAVGGVATFPGLSLDRQGTGYRLSATTPGFGSAISSPFAISPAAVARLGVAQQPTDSVAAAPISPAVQIAAEDAFGNRVTSFTGAVTIEIGENPGASTLTGTLTINAISGIASFTTLQLDHTGVGYTLVATAPTLTEIETDTFDVTAGSASSMAFVDQPGTATAGLPITPAVTVHVLDGQGNTDVSFTGNITVAISNNAGGSSLSGTVSVLVTAGVATFDDLSLDKVGIGYTLAAMATGVPTGTSAPFDVVAGDAVTYVQTGLAANVAAGVVNAVVLTAHDAHGNVATGYDGTAALTSTDTAIEVPAQVQFTDGVGASAAVAFHTLGAQTLTATDTGDAAITAMFDTNVTMGEAPMVAITSPANGAGVGGNVRIEAAGSVAASSTLVMIEVLVDGAVIGMSEASPTVVMWDATSMPLGSTHTITARITDAEGNVVESAPVVVTVIEAPDDGCGCRSASRGPGLPVLAGLVMLALVLPRRRRAAQRRV